MAPRTSASSATKSRTARSGAGEPQIVGRGAREHNLKKVNVELRKHRLSEMDGEVAGMWHI